MSPRRSSRSARTTQPPPSVPAHSTSASSVSSGRTDRATRSNNKQSSPQKSSTPHSLSSDEVDEAARNPQSEPPQTRRRTREQDNDEDESAKLDDELDDDIGEEEEITRCVCGQQEYPGPPSDAGKPRDGQFPAAPPDSDIQNDEAGGLFIQCDVCKVWQHGGCVGIMDEAASPEEYFCEECRKDLHKLMTSPKGQRYSRYLPISDQTHAKSSKRSSVSKDPENKPSKDKDKSSRASADSLTKRRSTMNSRATYDEDEVLRKVLEESKSDGGAPATENGNNRKKRSRDDSEEIKQEPKRQRTGSRSPTTSPTVESDDETLITKSNTNNGRQKPRGAAARSQREKELREKEKERERERAEAAGRRKGRVERRRADDPEPVEQTTVEESAIAPSATESVAPDTSSAAPQPAPSHKKSGRPPQKRVSRLGRNQYTRDLPTPTNNGTSPARANNDNSPNSPQVPAANGVVGNGHESSDGAPGNKYSKVKNWRLEKMSWNDIRRPAGIMQNYITQRQVDLAREKSAVTTASAIMTNGNSGGGGGVGNEASDEGGCGGGGGDAEGFKNLSTLQMMDDLSRELVLWQRMVAEISEK
ncbi:hypothetical protein K432DRAFT_298688 [Lepidopterella palustris CBS 459.81]|uniref:Zinc finger PHD-type domain-containing protein n=1 Tax=Lepidopterella palustris CBS 459.81 TaxID=1314670 RepID=A0A8E2E9T1_9PEZI|nr:hypothetical protein K432DRAFT_298688 [Lepidopterella palustris CBS 459.81]